MLVAVPCEEPSPNAPISPHFGRAKYFCIFDGRSRRFIENPGAKSARRSGVLAANALVREGVNVVIAKSVGPNSGRILEASGIRIIITDARTPEEAVRELNLRVFYFMRYIDELHREHKLEYKIRKLKRRPSENLERIVRKFYEEVRLGSPILVEGKHDVSALEEAFGFGNYVIINRKRRTLRSVLLESVTLFGRRQIVLTDLDKKGNELARKITEILYEFGAFPVLKYRNMLKLLNVTFVENITKKAHEIKAMLRIIDVKTEPWPEFV